MGSAFVNVDVVVLSRTKDPLPEAVRRGLANQSRVHLRVHRALGKPEPGDRCRWESIARGRNRGKSCGSSPWLMFLDDDVVLSRDCVRQLVDRLERMPVYGALAADYLNQLVIGRPAHHVAMGATLFRRSALDRISFRWETARCECQCCCDDLRDLGYGISYYDRAKARHLRGTTRCAHGVETRPQPVHEESKTPRPRILTAFDHRHFELFRRRFIPSLRNSGNSERITAVGYGLPASQRRWLEQERGVELLALPDGEWPPQRRRLHDFQQVLAGWPESTPVAYWDAGDVVFQSQLQPLWTIVARHPGRLLATREPLSHPQNRAVANWTLSIRDPSIRRKAFDLLSRRPFINGGFAAGTAAAMRRYLRYAESLRNSWRMRGTSNRGDQTVMNLYLHANSDSWREVGQEWNYCLFGRQPGEVRRRADGRYVSRQGDRIFVVHGNARTMP